MRSKNSEDKLRPLIIEKMLRERTDEDTYLTTNQIAKILKDEYGMEAYRTTIKRDIDTLRGVGIGIQEIKSTQNRYKFLEREFDRSELKLLIDAVWSSKFIPKATSKQLADKLMRFSSKNKAPELKRNLVYTEKNKSINEKVFEALNSINQAINDKKQIRFQMTEYTPEKKQILHNKGEEYRFSPYSLVWDGDNYYMVGYSNKYKKILSHRIDRIHGVPEVLQEDAEPMPKNWDVNEFVNTKMHMFGGEKAEVKLACDNDMMQAVIDNFGKKFDVEKIDDEHFEATIETEVSNVFYSWVFGFDGKVKISGPKNVKQQYQEMIERALK